jgi:hypothetical protein
MRASLLHPLREPRPARLHRRAHRRRADDAIAPAIGDPAAGAARRHDLELHPCDPELHLRDPDAQRVREAGGPIDRASYTCSCGCLFSASVSTSVVCPHCGAYQAW